MTWQTWFITAIMSLAVVTSCDDDDHWASSDLCRLEPENCNGGAGALCDDDRDCISSLHCCRDNPNCGEGMCTVKCDDDRDCPYDMLSEHHLCFYRCESDRDCAPEMSCEHGNTICEYE